MIGYAGVPFFTVPCLTVILDIVFFFQIKGSWPPCIKQIHWNHFFQHLFTDLTTFQTFQ